MAVALGTLTPTSMTVVATSTSTSPAAKRRITSSLASGCIRPCSTSTRRPRERARGELLGDVEDGERRALLARRPRRSSSASSVRPSRLRGLLLLVADARADHVRLVARLDLLAHPLPGARQEVRLVLGGHDMGGDRASGRPGSWSRTEVSRSPKTVIATVRGIGVAVMTSRCGGCSPLERSASRCSTPKRCCSSTTTRPRSWNCTLSSISAWVPMTIPASPVTRSSSACRRAAAPIEPVSSTTLVPCSAPPSMPPSASSPIISVIERWCCWARTSVGASIAAWPPASTTASIARSATSVLPEPTSPWRRRCIGCSVARSAKISRRPSAGRR